ncbi:MAG: glycosyltransferase family 2 protein [Cyclobacteriaceae bacterium]
MPDNKLSLTVLIPVFNEDESLPELYEWVKSVVLKNDISHEILFIDDGSDDDSWRVIEGFSASDSNVRAYRFTRNYGKSAALQMGFQNAEGDIVITLDADLQDSPDEIPALMKMINEEKYHLVSGWKKKRHDPLEKRIPSKFFNGVTSKVSGIKLHDFNCGLKAYKRQVVKSITLYGEMHRYIPLLAKWNGFNRIGEKVVEHRARKYGTTKFGFRRYLTGFLDLLSVIFVTRFRKNPMHFFGALGTVSFLFGFFVTVWVIGEKIYRLYYQLPHLRDVVEQPLFYLALVALIVGVQLFLAGFLGEMVMMTGSNKTDFLISDQIGDES